MIFPALAEEPEAKKEDLAENDDPVYSLEYAKNSPIHSIPLQNASLRLQLFANGNPKGFMDIETDDKQSFSLRDGEVFEIISIKGEEKHNARCSGYATTHHKTIAITCNKR
jgi:hypothetical protein